jgi:hypothetical protein
MRSWGMLPVLLAGVGLTCACNRSLPDPALVSGMRVLAVKGEPPEAPPGTEIHFTALVADPNGAGRPIKRIWALCSPGEGGIGTCGNPANTLVLGTQLDATWTIPAAALDGLSPLDAQIGRDVYVVLAVQVDDGTGSVDQDRSEHDVAFKHVRVSTNSQPNKNPRLTKLTVEKTADPSNALTELAGQVLDLQSAAAPGSMEKWVSPDGATSGVEDSRYTWLISGGSVDLDISYGDDAGRSANRWHSPGATGPATLWVVLRDGRGGTDWAEQEINLQ